ncbi:hypothetical protein Tco_0348526, partial [Tanacetum coccineum]
KEKMMMCKQAEQGVPLQAEQADWLEDTDNNFPVRSMCILETTPINRLTYFGLPGFRFEDRGKSQSEHIDEFRKLVGNLTAIDTAISDEDKALLLLLTSLPSSYDNSVQTLLYRRDTLKLEDSEEHLKKDCPRYNHKKSQGFVRIEDQESGYGADGRDYFVDFEEYEGGKILLGDGRECVYRGQMQSVKIKVIKGSLVVLSGTRRANCVYTLDGQAVTRKTLKGRKQLGEYLGGRSRRQQNGLVKEMNVTLLAKVVLYRNMGFNESGKYKKTFIGSGVGTGSVQVLQGVEFKVEPREDHTFEVEPHGNVDHVAGSQEVKTQDLIYYHLSRDREQYSTHKLFSYRVDSNEAAFAVAEAEKIYAHESLTFNNTVACEVISKWKAGLKDDMDARSDVYVLSNGCKKCSDDSDVYYWAEIWATKGLLDRAKGNVLGMEIVRDQSGNTLRVSQSRFYNRKLVQTLLEGHSILLLEGSLSRGCDVEKNGKWSCIYAVGSQEYQMVCTRLDIASADHMMALSPTEAGYMTLTEAAKEAIWLKGLAIESGFELKIVAGIATGALSKDIPGLKFQHRTAGILCVGGLAKKSVALTLLAGFG